MAKLKKPAAKKPAAKKPAAKKPAVAVAVVGVTGAGMSTLVEALAPRAKPKRSVRALDRGGITLALRDVPGDSRTSDDDDYDDRRFTALLDALEKARVIVHVIDPSDPEAEAIGARLDRWIYGSWHDHHARVVVAFNRRGGAPVPTALRAWWPDAVEVDAREGHGIDGLADAIVAAATQPLAPDEGGPDEGLRAIQVSLVRRTRAPGFDGAAIAADLERGLASGEILGAVLLREGTSTWRDATLTRDDDGLRFLGRLHENVWDADVLHLVARDEAGAKRLAQRAKGAWGAAEAKAMGRGVVRARWSLEDVTTDPAHATPTAQELQVEIIRGGGYNAFRGDRVARWLEANPRAWRAVAFGRLRTRMILDGTLTEPLTWFNTVRELAGGRWNADELWVVAHDAAGAARIAEIGAWHWFADNVTTLSEEECRRVANVAAPARVVELWWD